MGSDELPPPAPSATIPSVVVFDFDGTLVSRDSFLDFALSYCLRRPARLLLVIALLPLALLYSFRSARRGASLLLWGLTLGTSTRSFARALRRYAAEILPTYANEAIFVELAAQLQAGHRVVIATGTMPVLVRGLLRARQLSPIPIVGTRLRRRWGGLTAETHCIGRAKVRELQRKLGIVEWSAVYTDSFADRSLLSRAQHITLIAPSKRTLRRTQSLIDATIVLRVLRRG